MTRVVQKLQKTRLGPAQVAGQPGKHGWEAAWGFQLPWLEKIPTFIEGSSSSWEKHRTKGDFHFFTSDYWRASGHIAS